MNLAQLYYFRKLAELQHYTKASQELHISQPTLSGAIACLESELGISLFQKQGRNVYLTKYGKEFYDYVCNALCELDTGIAIAKEHAGTLSGFIDIGSISTIQGDYLPLVLKDFNNEKGTHIKFNIYQAQTNAVLKGIKTDIYDIGFCTLVKEERDLLFVPILPQSLIVVVNKEHPLAGAHSLTFAQLQDTPLISYQTEQPVGKEVNELLKRHNLKADYRYSDEVTLCGVVRLSSAAAVLLKTPSLIQFSDLSVISLPEVPDDFHVVQMVFCPNHYKSHAVKSFIEYVKERHSYRSLLTTS